MLPILQVMIDRIKAIPALNFQNVTFVCVQHLLFTTVDVIECLLLLNAKPTNIHIMGKIYSSCPVVATRLLDMKVQYYRSSNPVRIGYFNDYFTADIINMWDMISANLINTNTDTIIILDDGGKATTNIPEALREGYKVFVVEQTSSGISHITTKGIALPVVNVAYSAAKQLLESPMIAKAVINKLSNFLPLHVNDNAMCGVVGLGAIGQAVVQLLSLLGHEVIVYDKLFEKSNLSNSIKFVEDEQLVFQEAEYIFGCTGEDITISLDLSKIKGVKNFISCSSQDIEFCSLLKIIQNNSYQATNVLDTIEYSLQQHQANGLIRIYRGGYPINLDNTGESVPAEDIQLTRALLFGGMIQAVLQLLHDPAPKQYMLNPLLQKLIVQQLISNPDIGRTLSISTSPLISNFQNDEWIRSNSRGEYINDDIITDFCNNN